MNRILLGIAALAAAACFVVSCKKEDPKPDPVNQAPTVSVQKPEDGISYGIDGADTTFAIEATATDPDGSISKVEFYVDGVKIGEDLTAPYENNFTFQVDTQYSIKVIATDNDGATGKKEFFAAPAIQN